MGLIDQLKMAVRFVGLQSTLRAFTYSRYRDRMDRRFGLPEQEIADVKLVPVAIEKMQTFNNGVMLTYNDGISLEVIFLSEQSVRLTWQPGRRPVDYALGEEPTVALQIEVEQEPNGCRLSSQVMRVVIGHDGRIGYFDGERLIRQDESPIFQEPRWDHRAILHPDARIYGLGERTQLNLRPGKYKMWNTDPGGSYGPGTDPLYLTIPVFYCQQPDGGYLIFYENTHDGEVDFEYHALFRFSGGALRFYFVSGGVVEAVSEYTRITGRPPMPPKWALGFHQSRWGYKDESQIVDVVNGFVDHDLPLHVLNFDIDHMRGYRVFTVDTERFPDFYALTEKLDEEGIKSVAIVDPGVKIDDDYDVYTSGVDSDVFVKMPDGKRMRGLVWPGWVAFPDFTNQITRRWWGSFYERLLEAGIAGFWHDMNEPASFTAFGENTFPRSAQHSLEGIDGNHVEAHNLYGLLMGRAGYESLRQLNRAKRPWILTRSGWAGIQRYAWKWTGDTESTWAALRMTVETVLGLGLSGIAYSGSDIGGFSGAPDAELFTRWFQMSALMPFFRNHAAVGTPPREPWVYGEKTTNICRTYLQLREKLLPYLYTLAYEAHRTGAPLARPVFWLDESDQHLWEISDAFMLGDALLVAPILKRGANQREVILPEGGWYDFWSGKFYKGGETIIVETSIEHLPLFVRAGTVLPLDIGGKLSLQIYLPDDYQREYVSKYYDDAGDGYDNWREDTFVLHRKRKECTLNWRSERDYPLPNTVHLNLIGSQPLHAWVNNVEVDWPSNGLTTSPFSSLRIEFVEL